MYQSYQIIRAEFLKGHRCSFNSVSAYFSLFLWPIISLINAYYSFKPFSISHSIWRDLASENYIIMFLLIGFLGYMCFWSLVQSAWQMRLERENGTLEIIFLTPALRIAIIYGRAIAFLAHNIWMFLVFSILTYMWFNGAQMFSIFNLFIGFFFLAVSAVVWGGLMNVIFLFSRDSSVVFSILDEPMSFFSGVRIPVAAFPTWMKYVSVIFPLTHSLVIVRQIVTSSSNLNTIKAWSCYMLNIGFLLLITLWLLQIAEKHARRTGNLTFY